MSSAISLHTNKYKRGERGGRCRSNLITQPFEGEGEAGREFLATKFNVKSGGKEGVCAVLCVYMYFQQFS